MYYAQSHWIPNATVATLQREYSVISWVLERPAPAQTAAKNLARKAHPWRPGFIISWLLLLHKSAFVRQKYTSASKAVRHNKGSNTGKNRRCRQWQGMVQSMIRHSSQKALACSCRQPSRAFHEEKIHIIFTAALCWYPLDHKLVEM